MDSCKVQKELNKYANAYLICPKLSNQDAHQGLLTSILSIDKHYQVICINIGRIWHLWNMCCWAAYFLARFIAKIQVNDQDIWWTLDLVQYLAQVARKSRNIWGKKSWYCSINNPNPALTKSNPSFFGGYFWTIHVTPSHFSS